MIDILRKIDGVEEVVCSVASDNATVTGEIMAREEVNIDVVVDSPLTLAVGDYVRVDDTVYTLNRETSFDKKSDVEYRYDLLFESPLYRLLDKLFVHPITGLSTFTISRTLREWVKLVVDCIGEIDPGWTVATDMPDTEPRNIPFESSSCREALNRFVSEFGVEFFLTGKEIHFVSRIENNTEMVFEQGKGKGLYTISQEPVDNENTITRIFPYGGSQNVAPGEGDAKGRLCLPEKYLENFSEYSKIVEKEVEFKDIFPKFIGSADTVSGDFNRIITCSAIDFDIAAQAIGGTPVKINILTGDLMGESFEFGWKNETKEITLIRREDETALPGPDGKKPLIPSELRKVEVGDSFNFTDLNMPATYKDNAVIRLREKATEWLAYYSRSRIKFSLEVDHRYLRGKHVLKAGDLVTIKIPETGIDKLLRVTSVERNLKTGKINCTVSNYLDEKWEKKIEGAISDLKSTVAGGGNTGGGSSTLEIIESTDTTTVPSETNVYSALLSKKEDSKRLRKDVADTASKLITFMEGLVSRMKAVLESGADFGVDGSGGHIEATGEAEFLNLFLREYLKTDKIQSQDFHAGALGTGFLIKRDPVTGKSYAEVDELFVRIKAFFTELEIKKLSYAGGNWIFSAAGMKCVRVEDKGTFYRCYFTASDGETSVKNEFRVDDQCRSQEFNIKVGTSQNVSNRYYWRLCVAVGDDYIDLSKSDCDTNSDTPIKGDSIVQLGNRTDITRQNAIVISAYGEGSPSITQHKGIKSYSLQGTEKTRISPELNEFTGEFHFTTGENVKDEVNGAKASAATADSKAVAAQGTATAAKNRLDTWASDGVISPTEKVTLKTEQTDIRAEKVEIVADAVKYSVSATAYVNAYTAYDSDLTYYTYATPENITVLPTFATRQTAYYSARTAILALIATAAKKIADDAQSSANQAISDAASAQTKANQADSTANAAKNRLDGWAADNTISPTEKVAVKDEIVRIDADKNDITNSYAKYGLGTPTAFNTAYSTYRAQLVALSAAIPENIGIPSNFATNQTAYYTQRTTALNAIATAAKSYVDTGVGSAKSYTDTTFSAVDGKITLAVDSVKIGTKNLLRKSGVKITNGNYGVSSYNITENLIEGEEYTAIYSGSFVGNQHCLFTGSTGYSLIMFPINEKAGIKYASFKVANSSANTTVLRIYNYPSSGSAANPATVEWVALYKGNIKPPMNWSPAPEDQDAYADQAANTVRTETNTKLEVIDGKIAQTVTKTEFNEMQIGGRNLIRNSKEVTQPATSSNWNYAMHGITQVKPGTIYIFSVDKSVINSGPDASAFSVLIYDATTNTNMASASVPISIDRQIVKLQTTPTLNVNNNIQLLIYTGPAGAASNRGMSFYNVKLEEGNKATAWSSAPEDLVQEGKDYANATFPTKTVYESAITQLSDKIELMVSKTEYSAGLSDAAIIASISPDMMLNTDPTFKKGYNGTVLYGSPNNSYARMPLAGLPNDSGYCLKIMNTGASSAGLGGFGFGTMLVANVVFVTKIVAKIPAGYGINWASNGGYGERRWLTSNLGDGTWREYIYYVKSLPSGTFNTTNYFYLSGTPGVDWYVAFATVYRLNSYQSYPTTTEYQTKITQLEDSISFKASRNDVTALTDRVTQAEIKLQPDNIWLGISDKTVAVTRNTVDLTSLNQNTYYPVTFAITGYTDKLLTISAGRNLNSAYGLPAWSTHSSGFSLMVKWSTNASGWGTIAVQRQILEYTTSHVTTGTIPAGSINQMTNSSYEYIYLRGGSKYDIVVEGGNNIDIQLRTSSFTSNSQTIAPASSVVQPIPELDQKSNTSDLLATGINLTTKQITVTAPTFRVQDNAGTPIAVFTTNAAGKPVLKAENIDVDNLSVKKITGAKGTFNEITSDDDRMKLYGGGINFRDSRDGITAAFGNEAVSAASGLSTSMYIERNSYAYGGVNISAILSAKGMWCYDTLGLYGNVALSIPYGKIAGLRVYVRRIAKSVTYGTSGIMDNWLIVTASGVTITLPNMTDEMDGHIIVISNRSNGNVTINGPGYDGNSRILGINRHMLGIFTRTEYKWDYSLLD